MSVLEANRICVALFLLSCCVPLNQSAAEMLPVAGGSLSFEAAGKGSAIVFSHGGFGDSRMWDVQFNEFAKHYRVIRYDHRGFGKSTAPKSAYSPVKDLEALLNHLRIDRAHLVGNSMGGSVVIDFAIMKPARVLSLTVVASGPNGIPSPKEEEDKFDQVFETAQKSGPHAAAKLWIQNPMVAVTSQLPSTAPLLKTMIEENASIFLMKFWPFENMQPPAAKRLTEIQAPALIILGEKDVQTVNDIGDFGAKGIKGARKEIIHGADHLPQMDNPELFNRLLSDFLHDIRNRKN